jgi:hypothetical protein
MCGVVAYTNVATADSTLTDLRVVEKSSRIRLHMWLKQYTNSYSLCAPYIQDTAEPLTYTFLQLMKNNSQELKIYSILMQINVKH